MAGDGISVIIPAYNVDGFIAEAYFSVAAQTRGVHQIVAVDDGSADGTAAWLRDMAKTDDRLCVLSSDRLGPSGARNVGLKAVTQPIIAFLDADDVWPPYKIERQMDRLRAADRPDVVSGLIQRFSALESAAPIATGQREDVMAHVNLGACLFRRRVFDVIGFFDESLRYCEDVDLMFRIREAGLKLAIMPEVMLYYRSRPGSLTQTTSEENQERGALAALRLSIGRRRSVHGAADLPPFTALIDE
jgi:glycosyltransferase involved in cell wall biosynthesis